MKFMEEPEGLFRAPGDKGVGFEVGESWLQRSFGSETNPDDRRPEVPSAG